MAPCEEGTSLLSLTCQPCRAGYYRREAGSRRDGRPQRTSGWVAVASFPRHDPSENCHMPPQTDPLAPPLAVSRQSYGSPMGRVWVLIIARGDPWNWYRTAEKRPGVVVVVVVVVVVWDVNLTAYMAVLWSVWDWLRNTWSRPVCTWGKWV